METDIRLDMARRLGGLRALCIESIFLLMEETDGQPQERKAPKIPSRVPDVQIREDSWDRQASPTLLETNPYLRDPEQRRLSICISAMTSSAVEGIRFPLEQYLAWYDSIDASLA